MTNDSFREINYISDRCVQCGKKRDNKTQKCEVCRRKTIEATRRYFEERNKDDKCGLCAVGQATVYEKRRICLDCWFKQASKRSTGTPSSWTKLKELFYAQDERCVYSGEKLIPGVNASIDHIVPKCRGGSNDISNLQWVTRRQNVKKGKISNDDYDIILENEEKSKLEKPAKEPKERQERRFGRSASKTILIKINEKDYDELRDAWKESGLTWSDFIVSLLPLYNYKKMTPSKKRHEAKRR